MNRSIKKFLTHLICMRSSIRPLKIKNMRMNRLLLFFSACILFSGCYSFKDVSIPPEVKTARVNYIENKAPYVNPQLSPQLTDR